MEQFTTIIALVGIVIVVASLLSSALDRSGVPLAGVFLALGAVLGPAGLGLVDVGLESPILRVLATLGLALVLFSDAVTINLAEVRAERRLAWWLLGPGTAAPAALTALAAWLLLDLPPAGAAILGAALASTDPVLLRRALRSRVLPPRAQLALRLETGMNDIILLPIIVLAMLLLAGGSPPTGEQIGRSVAGLFLLGPAFGALTGWVGIAALVRVRSRSGVRRDYESLYALALAFVAFAAAEAVGGSGFVAAFTAGLVVSAQDVEMCDCFLEYGEATSLMLLLLTLVAFGASLIWTGIAVADPRTLLFAAVALGVRTLVLIPVLRAAGVTGRDCRLIAWLGPRGISSLLLVLLPVFAGVPGAERLFSVACLVVLLSVLLHGTAIAMILRERDPSREPMPEGEVAPASAPAPAVTPEPERITLAELEELWQRARPVVIADARTERSYLAEPTQARDAVRLPPDDPVRAATALRLPRDAPLVIYCT